MQDITNPLVSPYNARQLARVEDRIVKYRSGRLSFYAFVADVGFFTQAMQEPLSPLCDDLRTAAKALQSHYEALVLDEEGGLKEPSDDERQSIDRIVQSMIDKLLGARTDQSPINHPS